MSTGLTPGGFPYPNGDDPVKNGDDSIKALATALDPRTVKAIATGSITVSTTGTPATGSAVVTFPVGRFAAAAPTQASLTSLNSLYLMARGAMTATSMTITCRRVDGATGAGSDCNWLALAV
jgi:hypothetical protein